MCACVIAADQYVWMWGDGLRSTKSAAEGRGVNVVKSVVKKEKSMLASLPAVI